MHSKYVSYPRVSAIPSSSLCRPLCLCASVAYSFSLRCQNVERAGPDLVVERAVEVVDFAVHGDVDALAAGGLDPDVGGAEGVEVAVLLEAVEEGEEGEAEHAEAAGAGGEVEAELAAVEAGALAHVEELDLVLVVADE